MAQGLITSYVQTLPQMRTVSDRIIMTDPMSIVMINALGLSNEGKFAFVNTPGKMYEWLMDTHSGRTTTMNTAALTSDTTLTEFTATDGSLVQPGDVLLIDSEYIWVSSVSSNVITGIRGWAGTQATHANSATITIVSSARIEGTNYSDSHYTEPTTGYNYSQIFQKGVKVSRSDAKLNQYGIDDLVTREIDKKMNELAVRLALLPYHGQRAAGSAAAARAAGGIGTFVTTNVTALASAALTPKAVEDSIQQCFDGDGNPKILVCNSWAKRKITDFYSAYVRTTIDENRGGIIIDRIVSPLGMELSVLLDRNCPTGSLYLLDTDYLGYITFDDFVYSDLGKPGDTASYGEIVGEFGFVVAKPNAHAIISGMSTSS